MSRRCRSCREGRSSQGICPLCDCINGIPAEFLEVYPELRDSPGEGPPAHLSGPSVGGLDVGGEEGPAGEADAGPAVDVFPSPP